MGNFSDIGITIVTLLSSCMFMSHASRITAISRITINGSRTPKYNDYHDHLSPLSLYSDDDNDANDFMTLTKEMKIIVILPYRKFMNQIHHHNQNQNHALCDCKSSSSFPTTFLPSHFNFPFSPPLPSPLNPSSCLNILILM